MKRVEISQQVNQLAKRTSRIKKTGMIMLVASVIFGVLAGIAFMIAHTLQPDYREFVLYVPDMLLPDGQQNSSTEFNAAFGSMLDGMGNVVLIGVVIIWVFTGIRCVFSDESFASVGLVLVMGIVGFPVLFFMLDGADNKADTGLDRIQQYVKEDSAQPLLEYIQGNIDSPEMRLSWEYACLSAQVAIKTGKPAASLAKQAVEGYAKDVKTLKMIPPDISYAMEMTAFNHPVTAPALHYEVKSLKKVKFFSGVARFGVYCTAILLILGLMLFSSGLRLKRRVSYLQTYY